MLKVACSGPGVIRTRNLLVTSPILYQLDHCAHLNRLSAPMVLGMFLTAVGRKVLSYFSFIVTLCHYLINCIKDSCCFIDDYCSVIIWSCTL